MNSCLGCLILPSEQRDFSKWMKKEIYETIIFEVAFETDSEKEWECQFLMMQRVFANVKTQLDNPFLF